MAYVARSVSGPEPQPILSIPTEAAIFLVLTVRPGSEAEVGAALADVSGLKRSVGFRVPEAELTLVVGIGAALWDRLTRRPRPADLHPFRELNGARHRAVATPGDLLFHIRAHRFDLCFELAQRLTERLRGLVDVVDEVHGFRSFDERDVLGFVDGTENPEGQAASEAVLIGDEDAAYAGGSYVIVQKYVHDLRAWDALSTEEQELAIGRTKLNDIEMPDEDKPPNSHLALNVIEGPDGEERQIMRFNMPFGRVGAEEFGTYYIAYARTSELIELMLTNMFIGDPPGNTDRILDFSTAVTGTLFFVPSGELLESLAPDEESAPADGDSDAGEPAPDSDSDSDSRLRRAQRRITRHRQSATCIARQLTRPHGTVARRACPTCLTGHGRLKAHPLARHAASPKRGAQHNRPGRIQSSTPRGGRDRDLTPANIGRKVVGLQYLVVLDIHRAERRSPALRAQQPDAVAAGPEPEGEQIDPALAVVRELPHAAARARPRSRRRDERKL